MATNNQYAMTNIDKAQMIVYGLEQSGENLSNNAMHIVAQMLDILDNPPAEQPGSVMHANLRKQCIVTINHHPIR